MIIVYYKDIATYFVVAEQGSDEGSRVSEKIIQQRGEKQTELVWVGGLLDERLSGYLNGLTERATGKGDCNCRVQGERTGGEDNRTGSGLEMIDILKYIHLSLKPSFYSNPIIIGFIRKVQEISKKKESLPNPIRDIFKSLIM